MRYRLILFAAFMAMWSAALTSRLIHLQVTRHNQYVLRAARQQRTTVVDRPLRRAILDVRGRPLAFSLEVDSAFAYLSWIDDPHSTARAVARILGGDAERLARRLMTDRDFVWIARQLDPPVSQRLRALDLRGLRFLRESKRYYPQREVAAPVLGFVGTDGEGLAGLELVYDRLVAGKPRRRIVLRDPRRGLAFVDPASLAVPAEIGRDLHLTLDAAMQYVAERELARAIDKGMSSGSAVLLDPRSGAILAMASAPGFDANSFGRTPTSARINRTCSIASDAGPLLSIFSTTAALETAIETGAQEAPYAEGLLPAPSPARLTSFLGQLGFGSRTGIDLPGENPGRLPTPGEARLLATPLQLAAAFAALINGGRRVRLHLAAGEVEDQPLFDRAISSKLSLELRTRVFRLVPVGASAPYAIARLKDRPTDRDGQSTWYQVGYVPAAEPSFLGLVTLDGAQEDGAGLAAHTLGAILTELAVYLRLPGSPPLARWPGEGSPMDVVSVATD